MKYKAVVFDLGRVLFDFDWQIALERLVPHINCAIDQLMHRIGHHESHLRFELGQMDQNEFFHLWSQELDFTGGAIRLQTIWNDIFKPIQQNLDLVEHLSQNYPIAILSNTNPAHINWLKQKYNVFDRTIVNLYSFEHALRKPDQAFYQLALDHLQIDASDTVFIDDLYENVAAARNAGMQAIHYTGQDLRSLLLI